MRDWRQINWPKIQMNKWKGNQRRGNLSKFTCWLDSRYPSVAFFVIKNLNCASSFGFISHALTLDSQIILTSLVANSYLCITLEKFWRRNKITPKYDFLMSLTRGERESERGQLLISQETKCGQIHFSWPEIFSRNWPSNSKAKEIETFGKFWT